MTKLDSESKNRIDKVLSRVARHYTIESADLTKMEELVSFFRSAYSDQFNAADYKNTEEITKRWEWANRKNPNIDGGQFPAWLCKDNKNNDILGHFAVIPTSLKFRDQHYPAVWGRDLVILPKFRKLGIGPLLVDNVLKNTKDKSVAFLIAGLNDDVYGIYKKFGFTDLGFIPLYVRGNSVSAILRHKMHDNILTRILGILLGGLLKVLYAIYCIPFFKYSSNKNIVIKEIKEFDSSFDKLWEKTSPYFPIIIKRDSKTLNWRFVRQPYWKYRIFKAETRNSGELKGYVILREGKSKGLSVGVISDMFCQPDDIYTIGTLVDFTVKYFKKKDDISLIRCNILHKSFVSILKKSGFISIPSNSRFMFTNVRRDLDSDFAANPENWFINYADSDLDFY